MMSGANSNAARNSIETVMNDHLIAVDSNVGAAGVFAPPDRGFPDDGVVAIGAYSEPGWVIAELDLDAIARVRADGQVLGHRDWELPGHLGGAVTVARPA